MSPCFYSSSLSLFYSFSRSLLVLTPSLYCHFSFNKMITFLDSHREPPLFSLYSSLHNGNDILDPYFIIHMCNFSSYTLITLFHFQTWSLLSKTHAIEVSVMLYIYIYIYSFHLLLVFCFSKTKVLNLQN